MEEEEDTQDIGGTEAMEEETAAKASFSPQIPSLEPLSSLEQVEAMRCILNIDPQQSPALTLKLINIQLKQLSESSTANVLWHGNLSASQLKTFDQLNQMLQSDYAQRKEVLLKRFEATAQTFSWSPDLIAKEEDAQELQAEIDNILADRVPLASPNFTFHDVLVADSSLLSLSQTSTKANLDDTIKNFVLNAIAIPDRGGRCGEEAQFTKRKGAPHTPEDHNVTSNVSNSATGTSTTTSTAPSTSGRGRVQGNWGRAGSGRGGTRGASRGNWTPKTEGTPQGVKRARDDSGRGRGGRGRGRSQ